VCAIAALLLLQNVDFSAEGFQALEARNYVLAAQDFARPCKRIPATTRPTSTWRSPSLTGKVEEAIAGYRRVLELKPGLYEAELNLGMLLLGHKRPAEAVPYLEAATRSKPLEFRPQLISRTPYSTAAPPPQPRRPIVRRSRLTPNPRLPKWVWRVPRCAAATSRRPKRTFTKPPSWTPA